MLAFAIRRLFNMLLVLLVVSVATFALFVLIPGGDPAVRMAGRTATPENVERIREVWGFDRPLPVQYARMMKRLFVDRDLVSYVNGANVTEQIVKRMPATISLAIVAGVVWLSLGVLVGFLSGWRPGSLLDRSLMGFGMLGISLPIFWLGIMARYYLAQRWHVLPDGGYVPLTDQPVEWLKHLVLPALVLSAGFIGFYGQVLRSSMLDVAGEDYVRTARAKGIGKRAVMVRHVSRNSLLPLVTLFGLDFAAVLGGAAILVEVVFDVRGVGWYAGQSVRQLDLPPIMGVMMYAAFFIVVINTIVDLIYAWIDPRVRVT